MSRVIPQGWSSYHLDEICEIVGGGTPERSNSAYWNGDIPWVSPTEITALNSRYISNTREKITEFGLAKSSAKLHPAGTVLMTSRASIGFAAINSVPVATNQGFQSFRCSDKIYNEFLLQLIVWMRRELERLAAGSTFLEISSTNVKTMSVVIPEYQEQQKIADILTAVDEVIASTQAQINKLKDLKTGMMQELLTKGIGHTEFKDSPVGRIPLGWKFAKIEDLSQKIWIGLVTTMTTNYVERGIPLIRNSDIKESYVRPEKLIYLAVEFAEKHKTRMLRTGDVVTVHTGDVGTSAVINEGLDGAHGFATINTRVHEGLIEAEFLSELLNSSILKAQIKCIVTGDGRDNLNLKDFINLKVPYPSSIAEQRKIVSIIQSVRNKASVLQNKLELALLVKKALMQDLLTGKVRVNVN